MVDESKSCLALNKAKRRTQVPPQPKFGELGSVHFHQGIRGGDGAWKSGEAIEETYL